MLKFKNYKILLLLMLFAFAGKNAWAGGNKWWCYQIEVDVKLVTGEGLVYDPDPGETPGTIEVGEVNKNGAFARSTAHVLSENKYYFQEHTPNLDHNGKGDEWVMKSAVPNTQNPDVSYIFKGWMYAGNAGDGSVVKHISGNNAIFNDGEYLTDADYLENIGGYAFYAKTQHKCTYTGENGVTTGDQEHINAHNNNPPVYTNDAIIYALFEKQELTPAVTILYDVDKCEVEYPVDYQTNAIGNTITITARRKADTRDKGWEKEFVGWADEDGNIVSTDNPWTLNIEKKAVYRAVIEDRYRFFRIKNYGEPYRYVSAISDEASSDNFMDLMDNIELLKLNDNKDEIIFDAGSIVQIDVLQNPYQSSATYVDITAQDSKASKFYIFNSGVTINSLPYDYITKTWNFKAPLALFRDDSGVPKMQATSDNYSKWIIEHLDLDLETKENYFSLDPAKLVEVGGKYYTTLRTSWNILFNPEQMTPYIVKSVDETEGTFEMEPITGNIIPAGTPVIIETKSNDIEKNRMVPTLTNAASGAVPSGNQLVSSVKYFPNQSVSTSNNYKKLTVNSSGQLAFSGNALDSVNGNEAYLCVANEVVKIETLPLSEIEQVGVKNRKYIVEDLLIAVAYAEDTEGSSFLWCKDQGDKSIFATTIHDGKQIDFLLNDENAQNGLPWDQSNWVALKFTGLTTNEADVIRGYVNSYINEKAITGELVDDNNYMLNISAKTLATTAGAPYSKNVYCTSNFVLGNLNIFGSIENGDGGYTSGNSAQNYFFMNPKVQEVCKIIYARWDADNNCFTVPITSGFAGNVSVNLAYNEIPNLDLSTALTDKKIYQFEAIVNRASKTAYEAKANRAGEFIVYPLNLTGGNENDPPTAISIVSVNREVVDVEYVNCMGVVSKHPFSGVNIVVTRYSDGSRTVVKVIK